jgi:hypothetical protein
MEMKDPGTVEDDKENLEDAIEDGIAVDNSLNTINIIIDEIRGNTSWENAKANL